MLLYTGISLKHQVFIAFVIQPLRQIQSDDNLWSNQIIINPSIFRAVSDSLNFLKNSKIDVPIDIDICTL